MNEGKIIVAIISNGIVKEFTEIFDEDCDVSTLLDYAIAYSAFRIPESADRELWNKIINKHWGKLDDCDYYTYSKPICTDENWITESGGNFYSVKESINRAKNLINDLELLVK